MAIFADRVAVLSATNGTGPMSLGAPLFSYQAFSTGFADGFVYYGIIDEVTGDWEVGEGTLVAGTTLNRDVVLSSSTGGLVSFVTGNKIVYAPEPGVARNNDQGTF